jgi:hypothetical protein
MASRIHTITIDMMLIHETQNDEPKPCDCNSECNGYAQTTIGMKVNRHSWVGCKRQPNVHLWTENRISGIVKGDINQWMHLFSPSLPDLFTSATPTVDIQAPANTDDDFPDLFGMITDTPLPELF